MQRQFSSERPTLQGLIPKRALHLASSLTDDDKDVLAYLVAFGRHNFPTSGAVSPVCKLPWNPWRLVSSKTSRRQQRLPSSLYPVSCTHFIPLANHSSSLCCHCFDCYLSFWSRWSASPNRDFINKILDEVENSGAKKKKKKKFDRKQAPPENVVCFKVNKEGDGKLQMNWAQICTVTESIVQDSILTHFADDTLSETSINTRASMDCVSYVKDDVEKEAPRIVTQMMIGTATSQGGLKKEASVIAEMKSEVPSFKDLMEIVSESAGAENEASVMSGAMSEGFGRVSHIGAMLDLANVVEEFNNLTIQRPAGIGLSLVCTHMKNCSKVHQFQWTKSNQVIPLGCDGAVVSKVEVVCEGPMAGRVTGIDLGGTGFWACVLPDALWKGASRLWDLVSVKLRSGAVEYQ